MTEFSILRFETYSYLINDHDENEKAKSTENVASNEDLNLKITNIV